MSVICLLNVCYMSTECLLGVYQMSVICLLYVYYMSITRASPREPKAGRQLSFMFTRVLTLYGGLTCVCHSCVSVSLVCPPPLRASSSTQFSFWQRLSRERPPPWGRLKGGVSMYMLVVGFDVSAWYPAELNLWQSLGGKGFEAILWVVLLGVLLTWLCNGSFCTAIGKSMGVDRGSCGLCGSFLVSAQLCCCRAPRGFTSSRPSCFSSFFFEGPRQASDSH